MITFIITTFLTFFIFVFGICIIVIKYREAEEAVELANKQVTSKSDIRTTSSSPPTHFTAKHKVGHLTAHFC